MKEEYLWNRGGEPDEEIAKLERLLAPLRHREAVPSRRGHYAAWWLAAAAAVLAGVLAIPFLTRGPLTAWELSSGRRLRAGQWIETAAAAPTKIEAEDTGELSVDPGSRLRLVAAGANQQRFQLERGTIHAFIWAPAGRFVVDTPSAKTIDLGCRYTLQVSGNGVGLLQVEFGWVAFESHGVESFIPEGAACITRPRRGPGTPYFADAPKTLINALESFDTGAEISALDTVVASARPRDALTLWHLLARTHGEQRADVFNRFAALLPLPPEASREAILRGDPKAFDAAWDALNLGNTDWWREWKRQW
jgi:hypothetical protein